MCGDREEWIPEILVFTILRHEGRFVEDRAPAMQLFAGSGSVFKAASWRKDFFLSAEARFGAPESYHIGCDGLMTWWLCLVKVWLPVMRVWYQRRRKMTSLKCWDTLTSCLSVSLLKVEIWPCGWRVHDANRVSVTVSSLHRLLLAFWFRIQESYWLRGGWSSFHTSEYLTSYAMTILRPCSFCSIKRNAPFR